MTSLADAPELIGFFSYSRDDDEDSENALSRLRLRIQNELRAQLGRSRQTLRLWQDAEAIAPGTLWEAQIDAAVAQSSFFIPIITPRVVASQYCGFELQKFIDREKALGRSDLVFPVLYIGVAELTNERFWRNHDVLRVIGERQYVDWREFRYEPDSVAARRAIASFCSNIATTLKLPAAPAADRGKIAPGSHLDFDEGVLAASPTEKGHLAKLERSKEEMPAGGRRVGHNSIKSILTILPRTYELSFWVKSLLTVGIITIVNVLYVLSFRWLNAKIPYLQSISSYMPGVYFGMILCFIQKPKIPKWFAWILNIVSAALGWYLAVYATISFLGEPLKIEPDNYFASSLGGAIGGAVGISCCLVGLCIGNSRLANLRCLSIVMVIAVMAGCSLLPLYLETSKTELQAWNAWAYWLLLAGWQSAVSMTLLNEVRLHATDS